jgi:hypothetical protein
MKKHLWWLAAVALSLGLVAQYMVYRAEQPSIVGHASWVSQPESFAELTAASSDIVEGEVVAINPGKPITVAVKGEPTGQDVIPTENITVRVISAQKGDAKAGQELVVFRTGGRVELPAGPPRGDNPLDPSRGTVRHDAKGDKPAADPNLPVPDQKSGTDPNAPATINTKILVLPEDPEYAVGSHVFLALTDGPDGTLRPVAPAARYEVTGDGSVKGVVPGDSLSASLTGRRLGDLQSAARGESVLGDDGVNRRVTTGGSPAGMPTTGHGHDTFEWIMFFGIGMLLVFAGIGTLALSGIRSAVANRRRN